MAESGEESLAIGLPDPAVTFAPITQPGTGTEPGDTETEPGDTRTDPEDVEIYALAKELRRLEIDRMTPREAIDWLYFWFGRLKRIEKTPDGRLE